MVMTALTHERVIERFQEVHGDRYDYSELVWENRQTRVTIICRKHGPFYQLYNTHMNGRGCRTCSLQRRTKNRKNTKVTREVIIARFHSVHGDKYNYSKVVYEGMESPVIIICPQHGDFSVNPSNHAKPRKPGRGESCPACNLGMRKRTTTQMVEQFQKVHGETYDYSEFKHEDMHKVATIICRLHGPFPMSPANHLQGHRCKWCARQDDSSAQRVWFDAFLKEIIYESAEMEVDLLGGRWGAVDLVLTVNGNALVLEYDGQYWHSRKDSMDKDTRKTSAILALGYPVIRLRTVETKRHPQLEAVPGAANIWVKDKPKPEDIERVKKVLKKWVHF